MFYRFLLPYERHTKGQEEKHVKRRESDSGSEKVMKDSGFRILERKESKFSIRQQKLRLLTFGHFLKRKITKAVISYFGVIFITFSQLKLVIF